MTRSFVLAASIACLSSCSAVSLPSGAMASWSDAASTPAPTAASPSSISAPRDAAFDSVGAHSSSASHAPEAEIDRVSTPDAASASAAPMLPELELDPRSTQTVYVAQPAQKSGPPRWNKGQPLLQGFFGAGWVTDIDRSGGSTPSVSTSDDIIMPVIGGGGQWKLAGDNWDFGLEGMLSFGWQSNATAIAAGGGGAAVVVDVGLFVFDLYGGPFLSKFIGDKVRVYVSGGPLLEWVNYDQDSLAFGGSGSGFGVGGYARTGIEFIVSPHMMLGLGLRWSKSTVDLNNNLGNLDLQGFQTVLTVTQGF